MRNWLALILCLASMAATTAVAPTANSPKRVFVIPIREEISPSLEYVVRRGVKEAMEAKADLLVLDMNTPGGRVDSMEKIIEAVEQFKGETVTYVNTWAFSAGALISFATQKIYMAPLSQIGAAAPVQASPDGGGTQAMADTVEVKHASAISAMIRNRAEKNGYNVELVDAMVKKTKELTIDGKVINEKGQLLTLTTSEAEQKYGNPPKPLLSSGTAESLNVLLKTLGYADAVVTTIKPTGAEKIGALINAISPLLLIIGVLGIYIEFKMPGMMLPGIVAVIAFLLYFLGGYVAGLSGMEWIIVFVIGLALVISEFFVHPGTVLPGIVGMILILISLVMAMVDMYPGTPAIPTLPQIKLPVENIVTSFGIAMVLMIVLARFLPKTPMFRALVSQTASGEISVIEKEKQQAGRVGQVGVAISNLRPGGKAQFGNDILDVITQGEMIPKGQRVRILSHSGIEAVVESAA